MLRSTVLVALIVFASTLSAKAQDAKDQVAASIESRRSTYADIAKQIWAFAELGFQEEKSSSLLQSQLKAAGFEVQAVAAGGMSIGAKGMIVAAKVIAMTAVDLFTDPSHVKEARAEIEHRRGKDYRYRPLLGDRKPPLDYMNKEK